MGNFSLTSLFPQTVFLLLTSRLYLTGRLYLPGRLTSDGTVLGAGALAVLASTGRFGSVTPAGLSAAGTFAPGGPGALNWVGDTEESGGAVFQLATTVFGVTLAITSIQKIEVKYFISRKKIMFTKYSQFKRKVSWNLVYY